MTNIVWLRPFLWVVFAVGLAGLGCSKLSTEASVAALDEAIASAVDNDEIHGASMWVVAPKKGLDRGFAHGIANAQSGAPMTVETPFLSASVGKLFVAAAVLRLVRDGKLSLDEAVTERVPAAELAGLPVAGGDAALSSITVRMLLQHRSGLPCYFSDESSDGAPRVFDLMAQERGRTWTRRDLLNYAREHYKPAGAPGEVFNYADTNYDLLGLVLEGVAGKPFHQVVRDLVLEPLGLTHTWYHALEPAPAGLPPMADVYIGDVNMQGAASLSADQAGGGLATSLSDLRTFIQQLVSGNPVSLASLASNWTEDAITDGIDVGLSAWRIRPGGIFFALGGLPTLVGHSGATGVWAYYTERDQAVYVGAVSQSTWQEEHVKFLLSDVVPVVERTRDN